MTRCKEVSQRTPLRGRMYIAIHCWLRNLPTEIHRKGTYPKAEKEISKFLSTLCISKASIIAMSEQHMYLLQKWSYS